MSIRLLVQNLPPQFSIDQFKHLFVDFKGYKDARMLGFDERQMQIAYIEFLNFECADQAKKFMQNYKIPGSNQCLCKEYIKKVIDYMPNDEFYNQQIASKNQMIQMDMNQSQIQQPFIQNQQNQPNYDVLNSNSSFMPVSQIPIQQSNLYLQQPSISNLQQQNPQAIQGQQLINMSQFMPQQDFQNNGSFNMQQNNAFQNGTNQTNMFQQFQQQNAQPYIQNQQQIPNTGLKNFQQRNQTQQSLSPQSQNQNIALFKIPSNATSSLYVDGVPIDSSEREVAHIFRPFPGFINVRLIKKVAQSGREFYFCFVDFENSLQSTIAMDTLQNYRFYKNDKTGLKITFANEPRESSRRDKDRIYDRRKH